jgi:hypothetical protein
VTVPKGDPAELGPDALERSWLGLSWRTTGRDTAMLASVDSESAIGARGSQVLATLGCRFASGGGEATVGIWAGALGNTGPAGNAAGSGDGASGRGGAGAGGRGLSSDGRNAVTGRGVESRCVGASGSGAVAVGGSSDIQATRGAASRGPSVWNPAITVRTRTV